MDFHPRGCVCAVPGALHFVVKCTSGGVITFTGNVDYPQLRSPTHAARPAERRCPGECHGDCTLGCR